jgi:hypothetical protein
MDETLNTPPDNATDSEICKDPLLRLAGSGKHSWAGEPADKYVNNLRDGWNLYQPDRRAG